MAQEVEFRLEKSFLTEDYMTLAFGDFKSSLFARSFLDVMKTIEDYMGKSPWEDFEAHTALRAAADEILLGHQPHIPADLEKRIVVWTQRLHGWEKKQKIWEEKGEDGEPPENPGPDPIEKAQIIGRAGVEVVRDGYKNELQKLAEIRTAERAIKIKGPILK